MLTSIVKKLAKRVAFASLLFGDRRQSGGLCQASILSYDWTASSQKTRTRCRKGLWEGRIHGHGVRGLEAKEGRSCLG